LVCLGNVHGKSCPDAWLEYLGECFRQEFGDDVALNAPFAGGYITRHHAKEMPWVQLELSRDPVFSTREKGEKVLRALRKFVKLMGFEN
jgi:N-formylglutamate amidohydrolase